MPDASCATTITARLLLRAPTAADLDVVQLIHGDPRTQRYNPAGPDSRESCRQRLLGKAQVIGLVRLGLTRDGELEDFPGLSPSLLYSLSAERYFAAQATSPNDTQRSLEP
jgi:hypothetical protein